MKRVLSLILAISLLVLSTTSVFAYESNSEITTKEKEDRLKEIARKEADTKTDRLINLQDDNYEDLLYEEHKRIMCTVKDAIAPYVEYDTNLAENTSKNIDFIIGNVELLNKTVKRELLETYIHKVNIYVTEKQYDKVNKFLGMEIFSKEANRSPIIMLKDKYPGYKLEDAVDYAYKYCGDNLGICDDTGYNDKEYPIYDMSYQTAGADCANFVSQCLKAGGMDEKGTNINYASSWFCNSKQRNNLNKVAITWRAASYFPKYWKNNCLKYKMIDSDDVVSKNDYEDAVYDYLYRGDVVSLCDSDGNAIHTVIITDYGSIGQISDLKYSAHSVNHKNETLYNAIKKYDKVRFYSFVN